MLSSSPVGSSMGRSTASSSSKQHPSYRLLEQNGFQQEAYEAYRRRCLKERKSAGQSPKAPLSLHIKSPGTQPVQNYCGSIALFTAFSRHAVTVSYAGSGVQHQQTFACCKGDYLVSLEHLGTLSSKT